MLCPGSGLFRSAFKHRALLAPESTVIPCLTTFRRSIFTNKQTLLRCQHARQCKERQFSRPNKKGFSTSVGNLQSNSAQSNDSPAILLTKLSKHIAHLELNSPKSKNAFSLKAGEELIAALNSLEAEPAIRCVLISGHGTDLTSGVDIKSFMGLYQQVQDVEDFAHRAKLLMNIIAKFQRPFKRLYAFDKPLICVQHGLSLGIGMELAACCDIRYCSSDVKMAIREVDIGIAADVGTLQLMPRLAANHSLMNELIFTGRYMTTDEALQLGFVSHVGSTKEATLEKAVKLAETIAHKSPVAVQGSKRNIRFSRNKPFETGLDYNAVWNSAMIQGNDVGKAIGAILSKDDKVEFEDF